MRFANINAVFGLVIAAGLVLFYLYAFAARRRALALFAQQELWKELFAGVDERARKLKAAFLVAGVFFIIVALMRPQWGFHWQEVKRKGLDIIIALDTSKSMLAPDVKPNRLERAKLAVREMPGFCAGDRLGLVAFSGTAFLECPLTVDYGGFLLALDNIKADTIPRGGTSLGAAIREAARSFNAAEKKYKALVIISDGEDHEGDALKEAREAQAKGIVIHCIGVGTKEGELIPVEDGGRPGFLKDENGNVVKSRLQENMLQQIALATGGSYIHSTPTGFGLDVLYRQRLSAMEKREFESTLARQYEERFQIPLALALLFLLCEAFLSGRKRSSLRANDVGPVPRAQKRLVAHPIGQARTGRISPSLRAKRSNLFIVFLAVVSSAFGFPAMAAFNSFAWAADDVRIIGKGNALYKEGKYEEALKVYEQGLAGSPDSVVLNFNAGASGFKAKEYEKAGSSFEKAFVSDDARLQARAHYNMGNTKYALGHSRADSDTGSAASLMRAALDNYRRALELDPQDEDAKFNYEFVRKELKLLEEKQQDQQQCPAGDKEDKDRQEGGENQKKDTSGTQGRDQSKDGEKNTEDAQGNGRQEPADKEGQAAKDTDLSPAQDGAPGTVNAGEEQEMSAGEARMLLEGARQEEILGSLRDTEQGRSVPVEKDW